MWTAYWQADGDMRYEIATANRLHTAEFERDEFVKRMTHPEVECGSLGWRATRVKSGRR